MKRLISLLRRAWAAALAVPFVRPRRPARRVYVPPAIERSAGAMVEAALGEALQRITELDAELERLLGVVEERERMLLQCGQERDIARRRVRELEQQVDTMRAIADGRDV